MKKGIEIKQHDITDCGAVCLASIAAYYGLHMSIAKIRQLASTDCKGTNGLGVLKAAEKMGLEAKAVKSLKPNGTINLDPLYKIPKPAIAHVIVKKKLTHYVVIYKVDKSHITVMDPAIGRMEKRPLAEFAEEWTGYLILMMPDDGFKAGTQKVSISRRFVFLLKPHKEMIIQAIFGAVVYTILGLASSIYL